MLCHGTWTNTGANQIQCLDADSSGFCDGAEVVWQYDATGNLLNDGAHTYTYDAANRLVSVSDGVTTTSYTYNGDGDRIAQTVDGVTTTYVIDTATDLTMVLSETTNGETITYLHGLGLVAQSDEVTTEYFLQDGLGSVRQLADGAGAVVLSQIFDPYGNPYLSAGAEASSYGFAGEQADANGLVFLRARYYNPAMGRFLNADPSRQERNPYQYAMSNPVLHTDPSGLTVDCGWWEHCSPPDELWLFETWAKQVGIELLIGSDDRWPGDWSHKDLREHVYQAYLMLVNAFGGVQKMRDTIGFDLSGDPLIIRVGQSGKKATVFRGSNGGYDGVDIAYGVLSDTIIHEVGHIIDNQAAIECTGMTYGMASEGIGCGNGGIIKMPYWYAWDGKAVGYINHLCGNENIVRFIHDTHTGKSYIYAGPAIGDEGAPSKYAIEHNPKEDFTESFMMWVLTVNGKAQWRGDGARREALKAIMSAAAGYDLYLRGL